MRNRKSIILISNTSNNAPLFLFFFFNDTATTEIYTVYNTLSLHDALPIRPTRSYRRRSSVQWCRAASMSSSAETLLNSRRSEEHTSELQSLYTISYAV